MKNHPIYDKAKLGEFISHADVAKLIRTALKKNFPTTKFSVTTSTYSMGGSVRIGWVDGPTAKAVDAVARQFQTRHFDGSIDMAHDRSLWLAPDGSVSTAYDGGTEGSMGTHSETIGSAHSPDAVLVTRIAGGYVSTSRSLSVKALTMGIEVVKSENWACLDGFDWSSVRIVEQTHGCYVTGGDSIFVHDSYLPETIKRVAGEAIAEAATQ